MSISLHSEEFYLFAYKGILVERSLEEIEDELHALLEISAEANKVDVSVGEGIHAIYNKLMDSDDEAVMLLENHLIIKAGTWSSIGLFQPENIEVAVYEPHIFRNVTKELFESLLK